MKILSNPEKNSIMKILCILFALCSFQFCPAQGILNKLKKTVNKDSSQSIISGVKNAVSANEGGSLSNEDIVRGLKEALSIGTENSSKILHQPDGFFGNAAIKILMPQEAEKVEKQLRNFGLGKLVDKAILSMNRAAEDAAGGITGIFWEAIKGMNVSDGYAILKGNNDAATQYLKKSTSSQLINKMRPVISESLAKVNATQYWKDVFTAYNKVSKNPVNVDLTEYVTEKALNGIFYSVAAEELKIRKDPTAQVTGLLKKVFGSNP